jgi:hypothetical protein
VNGYLLFEDSGGVPEHRIWRATGRPADAFGKYPAIFKKMKNNH